MASAVSNDEHAGKLLPPMEFGWNGLLGGLETAKQRAATMTMFLTAAVPTRTVGMLAPHVCGAAIEFVFCWNQVLWTLQW